MTTQLPQIEMFQNASIIIAAINETYSLKQTVNQILDLCHSKDLAEILIVVCKRTTNDCLSVAYELEKKSQQIDSAVPIKVYCQVKPFVGMAYREAFDIVTGSHAVMMSADLETPPEIVPSFIEDAKKHPFHIINMRSIKILQVISIC